MNNEMIEKLHEIANIENSYYFQFDNQWLTLEDELDMALAFGEDAYADTVRGKMAEREQRILAVMM